MARVTQSCDIETSGDVSPERRQPRPVERSYMGVSAYPVVVNERETGDPDLSENYFHFRPRTDSPPLPLGRTYLLLLDVVKELRSTPPYRVSHRQVGFEVIHAADGDRVRPIVKGG